nr:MAG TPA: hypothetical protein [Bacteriophage sp.]DAF14498.1 MAG TPA: hypothetical protein [Crassvirales sp.]
MGIRIRGYFFCCHLFYIGNLVSITSNSSKTFIKIN